ncbi:hypothetical protein [Flintibacter muris]|uniref:hypothetical protein n=1 Tax=Flintibacter muris TaxID=2941327 RepID=UPI002041D93B|nr:hypothetical protein [Flintibacter muris]
MAAKKNKRRQHSRTVELKRQQEQEKLADAKDRAKKRMDPTARLLLYGDLVFLALFSLLEYQGLVSELVGAMGTIIGVILLIVALWFQFGKGKGGGSGPRL